MTGFRIGYACSTPDLIEAMMKVHQYTMMCAPILSQEAAIEAIRNGDESVCKMRDAYHKRRDYFVGKLNDMRLKCHLPKGSFYAFPDISSTGLDGLEFANQLLESKKVAVVPGSAFGESGKGFVRCSFSVSYERLIKAGGLMAEFVSELK